MPFEPHLLTSQPADVVAAGELGEVGECLWPGEAVDWAAEDEMGQEAGPGSCLYGVAAAAADMSALCIGAVADRTKMGS